MLKVISSLLVLLVIGINAYSQDMEKPIRDPDICYCGLGINAWDDDTLHRDSTIGIQVFFLEIWESHDTIVGNSYWSYYYESKPRDHKLGEGAPGGTIFKAVADGEKFYGTGFTAMGDMRPAIEIWYYGDRLVLMEDYNKDPNDPHDYIGIEEYQPIPCDRLYKFIPWEKRR